MSTYSIEKGRTKLLDDFRGDRIYGEAYTIMKDYKPTYEVTISTLGDWCDCPAGKHSGDCKHLRMVYEYLEEQK
jgi:hypothetical protein